MACDKTKSKAIALANAQDKSEPTNESEARSTGNLGICSGFTFDWLRKRREFYMPITKHSNAKPNQTRITFNSWMKTVRVTERFHSRHE